MKMLLRLVLTSWILLSTITIARVEERSTFLDGAEFIIVNEAVDFATAKERCINRSATLARISSVAEHDVVVKLMNSFEALDRDNNVWIGRF